MYFARLRGGRRAGFEERGRERGLFWVHRQEHGYKGARNFHVILRGTIFRTVGARVEIDVWASLSYSHLHWWLHARPHSRTAGTTLFAINDGPTRISQPTTTIPSRCRGHRRFALFVRFPPLFLRDEQRSAKFGQTDLARTRELPRECISVLYPTKISLTHTIDLLQRVETLLSNSFGNRSLLSFSFFEITLIRCAGSYVTFFVKIITKIIN